MVCVGVGVQQQQQQSAGFVPMIPVKMQPSVGLVQMKPATTGCKDSCFAQCSASCTVSDKMCLG
ncbi:unnamed protein product, partial [Cylicostephanus goldi]